MDVGDLIFLILIGIGFLSSLGGRKRRKPQRPRPRRPQVPTAPHETGKSQSTSVSGPGPESPTRKSRFQGARDRVRSQMEELLREIERQSQPAPVPQPAPEPPAPEPVATPPAPSDEVGRAYREPVALDEIFVRDGQLHQKFHDKYISPLAMPIARSTRPRVKRYLGKKSLREAVLLKEMLSPPKALRD